MQTRTGHFPIGFRRGGAWQKDLPTLLDWARRNDFGVIDLTGNAAQEIGDVFAAGMRVGSVDLPDNKGMIAADKGRRAEAIARNSEHIRACAAYGQINHFLVMLPENPALPRRENFGYMVESFGELVPVLEANDARLVIEGWPGPGALCCTPEGYRAAFKELPSKSMGINYDPSHLIRQGIDPMRFLREFVDRVYHIHGKDTELIVEGLYEYGHEQPATFATPIAYGGHAWRYTIPGHGTFRWTTGLGILVENGYTGAISIELEDANFHKIAEAEQLGITQGAAFLTGC
jgi:sugar phosphate isomerase/epimerase